MAAIFLVSLFCLAIAYVAYYYWWVGKYPKGPTPIPLVGNILTFDFENSHTYLQELSKQYGDVFTIFIPQPTVCVMTYEGMKDAFVTKGDDYLGRSGLFPDDIFQCIKNGGIVFSEGDDWRDARRTSLHILRDYGMGSQQMDFQVRASMEDCLCHLREMCAGDTPVNFRWPLQLFVGNVISNVLFGLRYKYTDCEEVKKFCHLLTGEFVDMKENKYIFLPRLIPGFEKVPYFGHKASGQFKDMADQMYELVERYVKVALKGYDPMVEADNFCQSYYQRKMKEGTYDEKKLLNICMDFYIAGMETTSTTLRWAILFLTEHQDVQDKMRAEIESVLGHNSPTLGDKSKLPYCNAVINEVQRKANIVSNNAIHRTTKDTSVLNHFVPANSLIIAHIYNINASSSVFVNPEKFSPERFLEEDGIKTKKEVAEQLVPFSLGKRQCAGEGLARLELFLCMTTLVQSFKLEKHPDHPLDFKPINGVVLLPRDPEVTITPLKF
ncbi:unnamed protein product [Auanema sp. JU1783]|nr:unnamed protein product [Auanema sp. JU1783]